MTREEYTQNDCCWPHSFSVPEGWYYQRDTDPDFRKACCEKVIDLQCTGDWLEVKSPDGSEHILYIIT